MLLHNEFRQNRQDSDFDFAMLGIFWLCRCLSVTRTSHSAAGGYGDSFTPAFQSRASAGKNPPALPIVPALAKQYRHSASARAELIFGNINQKEDRF